jgi:hypothetical protein
MLCLPNMTSFEQFVTTHIPGIEARLKLVLDSHDVRQTNATAHADDLHLQLATLLRRGGKRLRPLRWSQH